MYHFSNIKKNLLKKTRQTLIILVLILNMIIDLGIEFQNFYQVQYIFYFIHN